MDSVLFNNKNIVFKTLKCPILKVNQRTETSFNASASGGGGNIYGSGGAGGYATGSITPINFNYSGGSVTYHEYWLKDSNGTEFTIELLQSNIRAREGNEISIIYANIEGDSRGFIPVIALNHGTKMFEVLMDGKHFLMFRYGENVTSHYTTQLPFITRVSGVVGVIAAITTKTWILLLAFPAIGFVVKQLMAGTHKSEVDAFNAVINKKRGELDVIFHQKIDALLSSSGLSR